MLATPAVFIASPFINGLEVVRGKEPTVSGRKLRTAIACMGGEDSSAIECLPPIYRCEREDGLSDGLAGVICRTRNKSGCHGLLL